MCLLLDKLDSNIKLFSLLMEKAKENILQASKLYVSMIDKYGEEAKKRFQLVNQSIPKTAWTSIERVGRGAMYEKILFTRFLHDKRVIMLPLRTAEDQRQRR